MALRNKTLANTDSAIGRRPALGLLSHDNATNGTAAMVTAAKGRSCQRGSKTEPKAAPVAITTMTIETEPRTNVGNDWVRLSRGPITSRNAGRARPDIKALAHNNGAAVVAASSEPHLSQPPKAKLS